MLTATDLFLQFGDRILFDHISLVLPAGEKVGLVGRNGAGKSTLLKVLAKEMSVEKGALNYPGGATIGFLHQDMLIAENKTVREEAYSAFEALQKLEERLDEINEELTVRTDYESDSYHKLLTELAELTEGLQLTGASDRDALVEKVLKGLGFKNSDFDKQTSTFSGGWQMRVELAKMLLQQPDYLFLDEPTNHLDIESILWLEQFLTTYPGTIVLISHDQQFINNTTERTVEIELGKLQDYKVPYYKYLVEREDRRSKMESAFANQQRVIAEKERTIKRFMAKATKTKMAQSMQKQLDKLDRIEMDAQNTATMNLRFPPAPRSGQIVLKTEDLGKAYGEKVVLEKVDFQIERGERVSFVGQNGQGKTTLAKILVKNIDATQGDVQIGHNVEIGYYAQNQSDSLDPKITLLETMEQHSPPELRPRLRAILGAFLFSGEDVDKKVSVLSGGERARLALACMLLHPFNLLVMDEPTNHLDIQSKEVLKNALNDYDGTLIVVSHDRDFLGGLTEKTIEFRDRKLHTYLGDINYFLEKRQLDNMRQVEIIEKSAKTEPSTNGTTASKAPAAPVVELSREERKELQKRVRNAENKMERLAKAIQKIELQMANPDFYNDPKSNDVIEEYKTLKKEHSDAEDVWTEAAIELEAAGV